MLPTAVQPSRLPRRGLQPMTLFLAGGRVERHSVESGMSRGGRQPPRRRGVVPPCGEAFQGGIKYTDDLTAPTVPWKDLGRSADVAQRYIGGVTVTPTGQVFAATGEFSRRFTDGPGADVKGHVWTFDTSTGSATALDGTSLPNVPANSVKTTPNGTLVVGTDLGVFALPKGSATWTNLAGGLPQTTVMDVEVYGGKLYAATHGRGIWSVQLPS
jgi:hypothetical protein